MDTPILKSGKKTKYRELPSTVIIFITQEKANGIKALVEICQEVSFSKEEIIQRLMEKFSLDESSATEYYEKLKES